MRFIPKIWMAFFAALIFLHTADAANFTASLDRDAAALGEPVTLSLTFEGGQSKNVPVPSVPGLQIVQTGTSQNMSFINGAMSSTVTINFLVTAQRAGEFTIPSLTANVNGQQLSTDPLKLTITQPSTPSAAAVNSGDEIAFMKLSLPQNKVYVGQTLTAQLKIYLRDDVVNYGQPQFNSTPADGFAMGKSGGGERFQTQIGSHNYIVIPIALALTVEKTGPLTLGPFTANMVIVTASANRSNDPFQQFFNQGERRQVSLATEAAQVESLPLPEQNKPKDFTGAVGDFSMAASIGPTNVTAGDPITVRVQISGHGALDTVTLPDQSALTDFKIFPPTVKTEPGGQLGLDGTKTFEEIVTPQNPDVREWPQFSFSYFNPADGHYHTLTQTAVPLTVKAAGATPLPTLAVKTAAPENQAPTDISPIKNDPGTLVKNSVPLISQPAFVAIQSLPVIAFLAALIWRKRTDNLANNPRLRRKIAVEKLMQTGLGDLKKFAAENNSEEFFATLFRLLQEQLGEKLDCPATAITENVVEENSILRRAPENLRADLREQFQLCNQARYAPVRGTAELNSVAAQFQKTIGELQNLKT